jgi:hypothetical protein
MGTAGRPFGVVLVTLATLFLGGAVMAAEAEHGPFTIDTARLVGLAGKLAVRVVEGDAARLRVTGEAAAVDALEVASEGGTLVVTAPSGGTSVTVVEQMTVVTGPGASSSVTIGGSSASSSSTSSSAGGPPVDIVLDLPAGTGLALHGFTGEAEIGDLGAAVLLQVIGGMVRAGAVADAELSAVGGGVIEVASVEGDLEAGITGDGRIAIAAGEVGDARIAVTGAGTVSVDAPAQSAVVDMVGGGTVRLAAVAEPPEVSRVGAGQFRVGAP